MYWSVEGSFEGFSEPRRAEAETYEVAARHENTMFRTFGRSSTRTRVFYPFFLVAEGQYFDASNRWYWVGRNWSIKTNYLNAVPLIDITPTICYHYVKQHGPQNKTTGNTNR